MARLKILSWNIWMMPQWIDESPKNEARASAIATELLRFDFDLIVFVKAFDGAARNILQKSMNARYPYHYGPLIDGSVKLNGGVYVLSRIPVTFVREIE